MISHFSFPTRIAHGAGTLAELPEALARLGVRRPLIVTDPGLLATPAFALLREVLPGAAVFSGVHPNPVEDDVAAAAGAFESAGCDGVVGFGGGSALDVAKIVRAAVIAPGGGWRDFGSLPPSTTLAPWVAIPTTAGTGSEVGRSSVVTIAGTKKVIFHPALLASLVILDPRVTAGLPPHLTAATGMDAWTHCLEAFTSPVYHPLCDGIALEGLSIVLRWLPQAVAEGSNLEARSHMLLAAAMGGIAFQKELGAVHSLSHPLSARFGLNHGLANALCLIPVMRFNARHKPGLYRRVALALELPASDDATMISAAVELLQKVGIAGGLRGQGVPEKALDALADAAFLDGCHPTNAVPVTRDDLRALYSEAWG